MKKIISAFVILFVALVFTSCSSSNSDSEKKSSKSEDHSSDVRGIQGTNYSRNKTIDVTNISTSKEIPVGQKDFQKLVSFIEKHGFIVPQNGIPSDYQYTFFDSHGNRHAMITIKRDSADNPSVNGNVTQISVWAFYGGVRDQDHYFGYYISAEKVAPFDFDGGWKEAEDVRFGYEQFLAKVNK